MENDIFDKKEEEELVKAVKEYCKIKRDARSTALRIKSGDVPAVPDILTSYFFKVYDLLADIMSGLPGFCAPLQIAALEKMATLIRSTTPGNLKTGFDEFIECIKENIDGMAVSVNENVSFPNGEEGGTNEQH